MPIKHGENVSEKRMFIGAEAIQESGGDYGIVNSSSGALGKWQVMPGNLQGWLSQSGLPQMSPSEYLRNHAAQDRLAWVILGGYYDTYGPRGAASMWYSGQPDWNATYGDPPVYQYVADVMAIMANGGYPPGPNGPGASGLNPIIPASADAPNDWSAKVKRSAIRYQDAGNAMYRYSHAINSLR